MADFEGGPAFPHSPSHQQFSGMTLRDYFAGKALPLAWQAFESGYFDADGRINDTVAECAYQMADAMLKAREVQNG